MAGQKTPELPRIPGLEQIVNDTIDFLLKTAFSTQDDAASQPGTISSQQKLFQASSSQQTALGSRQQKSPCDGRYATRATIPADASLEAPKSNFELVEPLIIDQKEASRC